VTKTNKVVVRWSVLPVLALAALRMTPAQAQTAREVVLHNFGRPEGANPQAGVIRDSAGNLYGTTYGGTADEGVLYKLDTAGNYRVLHNFRNGPDELLGSSPVLVLRA
jgi:uncharacterized repeat protein (TIGR03803 family)